MYKVFIDNKEIVFTKNWKKVPKTLEFVHFRGVNAGEFDFVNCRNELPIGCTVVVETNDPEQAIRAVFSHYDFVEAAGGIVKRKNKYLFIERHGLWDIPKGKMETGEQPQAAAVREIEEECGIADPVIHKLIGVTYHTYMFNDRPVLKKNWWYALHYDGPKTTIPQTEEAISKAVWLTRKEWLQVREQTYASIAAVLDMCQKW